MEDARRTEGPLSRVAGSGDTLADDDRTRQPTTDASGAPAAFRVRTKVWVERADGTVLISEFRADLLEHVASEGSVAAAARLLKLPNRTAWKKLEEMERAAGVPLIDTTSGGASGGGTTLTEAGRALLDAYRRLSDPTASDVDARFAAEREAFAALPRADDSPSPSDRAAAPS